MQPEILYILYATSFYEQTGVIITFFKFKEGGLVENKLNVEEEESISDSIDDSSTYDDSDHSYISINALEDIQDGSQIHPDLNAKYAILKMLDCTKQT